MKGLINTLSVDLNCCERTRTSNIQFHFDEEYFKVLTAEHCVTRFHKGVARREWVLKKGQRRSEALDRFVYHFVVLKILNPNFDLLEKNMAVVGIKVVEEGQ